MDPRNENHIGCIKKEENEIQRELSQIMKAGELENDFFMREKRLKHNSDTD